MVRTAPGGGFRSSSTLMERPRVFSGARPSEALLLIAGPGVLGVALGQGLAHEPTAIDYLQLNQTTKQFEPWLSNRRNL